LARNFIRGAIKHKGSLTRFARAHHALDKNGNINLAKAKRAANRLHGEARTHRLREINLARTLRRLRA
jgi:hypothetical protein